MKSGAIGAAGVGIPDKATIDAWIQSFAAETVGASAWTLDATDTKTASILREVPAAAHNGEARAYRLTVNCAGDTHKPTVQLAWASMRQTGTLQASVDGDPALRYPVDGNAVLLGDMDSTFPVVSLTIHLFPDEIVVFPV